MIDYAELEKLDDQVNGFRSRPALLLTLDTCCVSALAADDPTSNLQHDQLAALWGIAGLAVDGVARLQLTTSFVRETERWPSDEGRAKRAAFLETAPILRTPVGGVARLDVTRLDSSDVLASDEEVRLSKALEGLLLPGRGNREITPDNAPKVYGDVDHLLAHYRSGADVFVTTDKKTILAPERRQGLEVLGIVARLPAEAFEMLGEAERRLGAP